jgi:glyoxylase-like metal-dependent hydrolase (beta-lactamase superfamily II)
MSSNSAGAVAPPTLPPDIQVFERGWLSSNNVLLLAGPVAALVDSGYCTHAEQTLALVRQALGGRRPLDLLLNTHLHSDHCGGNAQLQQAYPAMQTLIPPGLSQHVAQWDPHALTFEPTGQQCPQFRFDGLLRPGTSLRLGARTWDIHAAKGHDPHSVILFDAASRTLISADALWESGFGIVFPELEGQDAFDEVADTLDVIESLGPAVVIPGHGAVFSDVAGALSTARRRLSGFVNNPARHDRYAAKALLKFKLLELQSMPHQALMDWMGSTAHMRTLHRHAPREQSFGTWVNGLLDELVASGAVARDGGSIVNL